MVLRDGNHSDIDMASSDVSFSFNDKKMRTTFKNMKEVAPMAADKGAKKIAQRLRDLTEQFAPKNTGKYSKEWKVEKVGPHKYKVVNPNKKLFKILEFTGKQEKLIRGDPLHFVINGKDIFVAFANTGAFKPIPHLRPAMKKVKREAKSILVIEWKKNMRIFK